METRPAVEGSAGSCAESMWLMEDGGATVRAECPRCGYDLSGAVATWVEVCPAEGVCTECGLGFAWGDVLNPTRHVPRWSYEQSMASSLFSRAWKVPSTLMRMLWPPGFWRAMRMEFVFRPDRLLLVAFIGIMLPWFFYVASYPAWAWFVQSMGMGGARWGGSVNAYTVISLLWPRTLLGIFEPRGWSSLVRDFPFAAWFVMLGGLLVGPCFVLVPQSLGRAKVRPQNIVRVAMYSAPILVVLCGIPWIVQDVLESLGLLSWKFNILQGMDLWHWQVAWGKWRWVVLVVTAWAWQGVWWKFAVTRYLRLPHGSALSVLLILLANLLAAGIMFAVLGTYRTNLVNDVFW